MLNICGVDVSKNVLDAFVASSGTYARFANDADGIAALAVLCRAEDVELVVMEATGGQERMAYLLLWQAGIGCAVVNAAAVRYHARSKGLLEKTDRIDAAVIASFAAMKDVQAGDPPDVDQLHLKALVTRLSQITCDLTVQKQRLSSCDDAEARASLDEVISLLKRQARHIEGEIASVIDDDPLWAKLAEAFSSIKGVAGRTIAILMAELPEIGLISNKAVSKLAGLAPLADDSGKRKGQRHIRGGRERVRSILYVISWIACKYDNSLAAFHRRLIEAGKPKMVARIAVAHKILVRLNAKAREARMEMQIAT
ncbi:IS110 family transposase [Rhizobium sp. LjRoot254]|uniref:IS110 family transposase n=1 Tax=Rhizobium sp. LjRoot254 TaxID=3342297 RepID=UPI003F50A730